MLYIENNIQLSPILKSINKMDFFLSNGDLKFLLHIAQFNECDHLEELVKVNYLERLQRPDHFLS